jgi:hypothetical protein
MDKYELRRAALQINLALWGMVVVVVTKFFT